MGAKTGIEWCDSTWNPIRGCSRVSEGCRHCYAESVAARFSKPGLAYEGLAVMQSGKPHWTGKIEFVEKHLLDPLKWRPITEYKLLGNPSPRQLKKRGGIALKIVRPRRIFVNSMSDLFHENVTDEMRDKIFAVMALCPQHIFQVLTKRPERMLEYIATPDRKLLVYSEACEIAGDEWEAGHKRKPDWADFDRLAGFIFRSNAPWPLPNVWLGVSVENQQAADERIRLLLQTPAAVRFISAEPLLGPVRLDECAPYEYEGYEGNPGVMNAFNTSCFHPLTCITSPDVKGAPEGINWVICGGESGPGARPMHPDWARGLRDQCQAAGVPFFFKQWGSWKPFATQFAGDRDERGKWDDFVNLDGSTGKIAITSDGVASNYTTECKDGFCCVSRADKHATGALLDGVEWKQFPGL